MSKDVFVDNDLAWQKLHASRHVDPEALEQDRSRVKVLEIDVVRQKLATSASGNLAAAATIVAEAGTQRMAKDAYTEFERRTARAASLSKLDGQLDGLQRRYAARVKSEPRVYSEDSPFSYFRDCAAVSTRGTGGGATGSGATDVLRVREAGERLTRYQTELAHEIREGSPEGQRALRCMREGLREGNEKSHRTAFEHAEREIRAMTTGGGLAASASGGGAAAFIFPAFLTSKAAIFRGAHRTFADQVGTAPMPPFGMQVYLPRFTSATSVTVQTEGSGVSESDPSAALAGAQVQPISGQVTLSQALYDRAYLAGGAGGGFDVALYQQLLSQYDERVDLYTLAQAIAGGTAVAGSATWTFANFYADLSRGREVLTDTVGTRLRPTHFFSSSDFYSYASRQVDSSGRPIVTPDFAPGQPLADGDDESPFKMFTGTILPGGVLWFEDDLIAATGGQSQFLVSNPAQAMVLCESEPIISAYPQIDAVNLEMIVSLRSYCVAITRYPAGTAVITGAAYPTSLV